MSELLPCPWCQKRLHKGLGFWCHLDRTCTGSAIIVSDTPEAIAAWNRRSPPAGADGEDAARWRALINSGRLSFMGSAGFTQTAKEYATAEVTGSDYMHFTMNFWNVSCEIKDLPDDVIQRGRDQTAYCRRMLLAYVDAIRALSPNDVARHEDGGEGDVAASPQADLG